MGTPPLDTSFLLIRLGHFTRFAKATATTFQRSIHSKECMVLTHDGLDLEGFKGHIELTIYERIDQTPLWDKDPDKIGAFAATDDRFRHFITFHVPTGAFEPLWAAAAATDGALKNIQVDYCLSEDRQFATIYGATYTEDFPQDTGTFSSKYISKEVVNPRIHPVVAELRSWGRDFNSFAKVAYILLIVWAAISIGGQMFSWLTRHQ